VVRVPPIAPKPKRSALLPEGQEASNHTRGPLSVFLWSRVGIGSGSRGVTVVFDPRSPKISLSRMVSLGFEKSQGRIAFIALVEKAEVRSGPRNRNALFS
jgi:hypothetical protein